MENQVENLKETNVVLRARELRKQGLDYQKIADQLKMDGFTTKEGTPFTKGSAWNLANTSNAKTYGDRGAAARRKKTSKDTKEAGEPAVKRRRRRRSLQTTTTGRETSKWDVLRSIELCEDINSSAKRALLDLVFKEINK